MVVVAVLEEVLRLGAESALNVAELHRHVRILVD